MTKISHPPRPPGVMRNQPRPVERRRASRGQAAQGSSPSHIDELDEDALGLEDDLGSSDHQQGDRPPDTQEQAWRRMNDEFRRRDGAESGQSQARGQRDTRDGITAQHLTADVQKLSQSPGSRGIFGRRPQGPEPSAPASAAASASGPGPAGAVTSSGAMAGARSPSPPVATARPAAPLSAHGLLATGKAVGSFVRELPPASLTDSDAHVRLRAAVGEAQRLLSGKDGIARVALGEDKDAHPVVLVVARRGVSLQQLLATVPESVQGVATRLSISFDVLPLRRSALAGKPPGEPSR
ncbi:hypothetical protein ACIHQR_32035 [Corallococcus coralloides]|uniref:hypothetical protein n=1 Tax=Corallococcus coralloides TaxID=184914 RepID=UPI00384A8188